MTTSTGEGRERELAAEEKAPRGRIPADTFANRLMLARALAGHLSIREAADLCGIGRGSWVGWERGARCRDLLDVVGKISEKLEIDHDWLLFGGPLLGARGRPVRRTDAHPTWDKRRDTERPRDTRPVGRPDPGWLATQGSVSRSTEGRPDSTARRPQRTGNHPMTEREPATDAVALLAA